MPIYLHRIVVVTGCSVTCEIVAARLAQAAILSTASVQHSYQPNFQAVAMLKTATVFATLTSMSDLQLSTICQGLLQIRMRLDGTQQFVE